MTTVALIVPSRHAISRIRVDGGIASTITFHARAAAATNPQPTIALVTAPACQERSPIQSFAASAPGAASTIQARTRQIASSKLRRPASRSSGEIRITPESCTVSMVPSIDHKQSCASSTSMSCSFPVSSIVAGPAKL